MKIINSNVCSLSNFEVMEILKDLKDSKKKSGIRNVATIQYETLQFLEDAPCKTQTRESINAFLQDIRKYKLTKSECLMMVNDPPETPLHIQLIVEDSEARLSEEQLYEIVELSAKHFTKTTSKAPE